MAHQDQKRRMTLSGDLEHRVRKSQKLSSISYDLYTVAWICALPKEKATALAMLDDVHETLPRETNDTNYYAFGSIRHHNIVIACLPMNQYGTNNAVNVLTNLVRTFPSIHLSLMVGIGGGFPLEGFDIRLGDVVVGVKVVQHDLGKIVGVGQMKHTAIPKSLHPLLGTAISSLQATHQQAGSRIPVILEERFKENPQYSRPTTVDRLFSSAYRHSPRASDCDECDPSELVQRSERDTTDPVIHYGTIASGNQVMRDSTVRDTIAQELEAICFEMEAAGLMDICPCLTIRGICDYSDSHKSKEWQEYAAATAAAYTREFLEILPPPASTRDRMRQEDHCVQGEKYNKCLQDLRETDPRDDKTRIQETKGGLLKDAYRWILQNKEFRQWQESSESQLLWIKGDPGKGKTMLLCGIIDELNKEHSGSLCYFFCQATEARLSNATAVLRGLIYLLLVQNPWLMSHIEEKYDHAGKKLFEDGNAWQALSKIFMSMLQDPKLDGALLIVDALDECSTNRDELLDLIVKSSNVKWIVTGRNWLEIEQKLDRSTQKVRLQLELNQESVSNAIQAYIKYKVNELESEKGYDEKLKSEVERHLVENADGTFLWVALVCRDLAQVSRNYNTRCRLKSFPRGLEPMYDRMLGYIWEAEDSEDAEICREILAVASVVYRPITLDEMKIIVESPGDDKYDELPKIIGSCGSFLTLREDTIYFVHQSAKDFLLSKVSDQILPSGAARQHELVFRKSLQALSGSLKRDICGLGHPGFPIDEISLDDLKPLDSIRYSCVYWVDHLHDSDPARLKNILRYGGDVHVFIHQKYLYWLESLSLLNSMAEGVKGLNELEEMATESEAAAPVTALIGDARRFIFTHKRPIEIAPLQVYVSALVFSPECSLIRNLFMHEEPEWIEPKPKMDKNWNNCLQTLEGHDGPVYSVAVSPDNQLIASGGHDGTVRIWDMKTGLCRHTLEGHDDGVTSVIFLPDGRSLASGSFDQTIKIWGTKTGLCSKTLADHTDKIKSVASSPDGQYLASGSWDRSIKIWDPKTGSCLQTLEGHGGEVTSVAFSPDGQRLVSGSYDTTVKIWDMETMSCQQTLKDHKVVVEWVAFSPCGEYLASNSVDAYIIRNVATDYEPILQSRNLDVGTIAFLRDDHCIAIGDTYSILKIVAADLEYTDEDDCLQIMTSISYQVRMMVQSRSGLYLSTKGDQPLKVIYLAGSLSPFQKMVCDLYQAQKMM
ncbi:hypothetical protein F53441_5031 [Fusarium austroafricanum]|uniref:NACHT domain-containing protein n=1 Tax=Fusarium austroafricanum TaxID=2364996 RepID=A0A8H4KMW4_9HYPO|nr:hypothetical protein F53441_5031 [Fusarium austroafricanum]